MAEGLPKITLSTFFLSVSSATFMSLGLGPENSEKGSSEIDLVLAQQNIDLLELLEEKTKGNRTPDEDRLLREILYETRMRFVEAQKTIEAQKQSGKSE